MQTNPPDKDIAVIIIKSAPPPLKQEEGELLSHYLNASEDTSAKYQALIVAEHRRQKLAHYAKRNVRKDIHFISIFKQVHKKVPVYPIYRVKKYGWAAAIMLLLLTGTWLFNNITKQDQKMSGNPTAFVQQSRSKEVYHKPQRDPLNQIKQVYILSYTCMKI